MIKFKNTECFHSFCAFLMLPSPSLPVVYPQHTNLVAYVANLPHVKFTW